MTRGFCVACCWLLAVQAFGITMEDNKSCPALLVVQEEVMDNGQTTTTLQVDDSFFQTDDQRQFFFIGNRSELFTELDRRAKRRRIIQKIVAGSATVAFLAGAVTIHRRNEKVVLKNIEKLVKENKKVTDDRAIYGKNNKIITAMVVSSLVTAISIPFAGDHGWQKHRDKLEQLFDTGQLTSNADSVSDLQEIIKLLEHYLDVTSITNCEIN